MSSLRSGKGGLSLKNPSKAKLREIGRRGRSNQGGSSSHVKNIRPGDTSSYYW